MPLSCGRMPPCIYFLDFIISKQKLCHKNNSDIEEDTIMKQIKNIEFQGVYFDEHHNGGTTNKTKNLLKNINNSGITISSTYTFNKCIEFGNIKSCFFNPIF